MKLSGRRGGDRGCRAEELRDSPLCHLDEGLIEFSSARREERRGKGEGQWKARLVIGVTVPERITGVATAAPAPVPVPVRPVSLLSPAVGSHLINFIRQLLFLH